MEKIIYFTHYFHSYVSCCLRTGSSGSGGSRLIGCEARTGQSSGRLISAALPTLRGHGLFLCIAGRKAHGPHHRTW